MTSPERPTRRRRGILKSSLIAALVGVSIFSVPVAAHADTLNWSQAAVSSTYGSYWAVSAKLDTAWACGPTGCADRVTVTYSGPVSGSYTTTLWDVYVYVDSSLDGTLTTPLPTGEYSFVATYTPTHTYSPVTTSAPLPVTITPTALTTDLRIASDPGNPAHAVVSVILQGEYTTSYDVEGRPLPLPAGVWTVGVTDADGEEVFSQTVDHAAGGPAFLNLPWPDVPPGQTFAASASFAVNGSAAGDFTLAATTASFTSPTASASPAPTPTPGVVAPASSDVAIPLWILILFGILVSGCAVAIAVVLRREQRRRATRPATPSTSASEIVHDES